VTSTLTLPEPDAALSPHTGWTRRHWETVADHWLGQVQRYGSAGGALPRLPGRVTRDGERRESMEAVGRSFLLAAPRIAGARGAEADGILEWYSRALLAGTRPGGDEEWPTGVTCRLPLVGVTNSIVEAANIAFGLYVSRDKLWANLTRPEQRQLAGWLRHHARAEVWQNNWQLFPAMAEAFLRSVGEDTSGCIGVRNVARVESWYLGDGWYTDGPEHSIDYYNAWAIHPYLWAWYRMTDRTRTPEGARHLERLHDFVGSYSRMFAPDGSTPHVGRSLTYRTAVLAALWCAELSGVNPLSPGVTRRLASGVVSRFVEKGVGVGEPLSLGWYDAFEPMCQDYSGFGSPYLAGIGFLGLAMDADAPVWTEREQPQPTDGAPFTDAIAPVGWTLASQPDGVVRLINHGSDHCWLPVGDGVDPDDPHYAKFTYSTHTAPGTGDAWIENVDSHLALLTADGVASRRCALRGTRTDGPISGSVHLPQLNRRALDGCAVTTVSMVDGPFELRAHLVETTARWAAREGGFAVADAEPLATGTVERGGWVRNRDGLTAAIVGIHGWQDARIVTYTGSNAMGEHSATPALFGECATGQTVLVALHVLTRDIESVLDLDAALAGWLDAVEVAVDGTVVRGSWASGGVTECDLNTFVPWDHHVGPKR
jgi:Uncharacterized protein conserved in bacteria